MSKDKASQKISVSSQKTSNRRPVLLIIIATVVIVAGGVLLWSLFGNEKEPNVVVTPDNVEDMVAQIQDEDRTPIGSFEVNMNTTWTFPNSHSASTDAYIANSVYNTNTVYFTIALSGSDEDIYTSPYIPVGSMMENITLNCNWPAGTYDTVLTYHLVNDEYADVSQVSVALEIIIQN